MKGSYALLEAADVEKRDFESLVVEIPENSVGGENHVAVLQLFLPRVRPSYFVLSSKVTFTTFR